MASKSTSMTRKPMVLIPKYHPPPRSSSSLNPSTRFPTGTSTPNLSLSDDDDELAIVGVGHHRRAPKEDRGPPAKKAKVETIVIPDDDDDDDEDESAGDASSSEAHSRDPSYGTESTASSISAASSSHRRSLTSTSTSTASSAPASNLRRSTRARASRRLSSPYAAPSRRPRPRITPDVAESAVARASHKPAPTTVRVAAKTGENGRAHAAATKLAKESETRRKAFLRKHKDVFLALLPNHQRSFLHQIEGGGEDEGKDGAKGKVKLLEQPETIKAELHDYQVYGYSWMVDLLHTNGCNGILADEMGLGKTLMTISLLTAATARLRATGASPVRVHLIVCPLSVLTTWTSEISRWSSLRTLRFHGERGERERLKAVFRDSVHDLDVVVTTYEAYMADSSWFKSRTWSHVVLDEGHRIKCSSTLIAGALQGVGADHRLILTGTPVQNNLAELWSLLHWLLPAVFTPPTQKAFQNAFDLTNGTYSHDFIKAARRLLELIMLRRTKEGVRTQLSVPPREEITLYVPLSPCQRFWTKRLLLKQDESALKDIFAANVGGLEAVDANIRYAAEMGQKTGRYAALMHLLMQLRKVCDHPYMMPESEPEPFGLSEDLVHASSKLVLLDKLLSTLLPSGHRVLIFSQFTSMLDILEDYLTFRDVEYFRLDGGTSRPRRNLNIRLFQQALNTREEEEKKGSEGMGLGGKGRKDVPPVFLISTNAGGLGITLTAADTVVMYDSSWNPQMDIQAIARAHRIGQTKKVTVYRLICHESVEQQMLSRLQKKLYLSLKMMGSAAYTSDGDGKDDTKGRGGNEMPSMSSGELCAILKGGTGALARSWGKSSSTSPDAPHDGGFSEFRSASFFECVERGREVGQRQAAKLKNEIDDPPSTSSGGDAKALEEAEAEEAELLKGVEQVKSRLFEGQTWERAKRSDNDIGREWQERVKRQGKETVVEIDGHTVDKRTAANGRWEAVKTITSDKAALAKLQNQKRVRQKFEHESFCVACLDGGTMYECNYCPRVVHGACTAYTKAQLDNRKISFTCDAHRCRDCGRNTASAGGMLFRCRTCPKAYCEDCLPEEDFCSVGDILPEFQMLHYKHQAGAHFIICPPCQELFATDHDFKTFWDEEIAQYEKEFERLQEEEE